MSIRELKVTEQQIREKGVIASPDTLTGTPDENKSVFDRLASEVLVPAVNGALEMLGEVEDDTVEWASDEAARQAAEAARASAEEGRVQAEQGRASAETARAQAENARVSAEQGRDSAETARVQAEQGRASAETNRVSAEQGRVSAETGRISAEAARAQAENDREDAEQARALAEQQRADENTGIVARATAQADSAEAAATRAESWAAGGTGTRSGEDTDNAKYYADQAGSAAAAASQDAQSAGSHAGAASGSAEAAAASARTASQDAQSALASKDAAAAAATRAEQAAENAEAIAGGDFIPGSEKGASGGVATLDESGKVPARQLPEMDYDPAGSAAAVQEALEGHTADKANPHGVTAAQTGAVPDTRTVNGMTLDADVTLTGEDIATSAEDGTTISSQLSNLKAAKISHEAIYMDEARDLHGDVLGLLAVNPVESDVPSINAPDSVSWGSCLSVVYGSTRQLLLMDHQGVYFQGFNGTVWSAWKPLATATKPQEFDLPLAEDFANGGGGSSIYWKDQFNQVHFCICVSTPQISTTIGFVVATLPEAFRPSKTQIYDCASLEGVTRRPGSFNVYPNGTISYFGDILSAGALLFGSGVFVAAD